MKFLILISIFAVSSNASANSSCSDKEVHEAIVSYMNKPKTDPAFTSLERKIQVSNIVVGRGFGSRDRKNSCDLGNTHGFTYESPVVESNGQVRSWTMLGLAVVKRIDPSNKCGVADFQSEQINPVSAFKYDDLGNANIGVGPEVEARAFKPPKTTR